MEPSIVLFDIDAGLFKVCFGEDKEWPCKLIELSESSSYQEVQDTLTSPGVKSVVIQDTEGEYWPNIMEYYRNGGLVVYFGIYGEYAAPQQLSDVFTLNWRFSGYTNYEYELTEVGKEILGDSITNQQYSKSNLVSVPSNERLLVPKSPWSSFKQFREEECDSEDDEETARKRYHDYSQRTGQQVPLALHRANHGGQVAYLGFVNGDGNIPQFVRALCSCTTTKST